MEAEKMRSSKVHHGHNIRRTRIDKNINQDVLSTKVNMSQPTVSRYENMRIIEEEILERFAKALDVPLEYLETLEEDAPIIVFENNTINNRDNAGANTHIGFTESENGTTAIFNPIDKINELYERLLKEKDDKIAYLEKSLQSFIDQTDKK